MVVTTYSTPPFLSTEDLTCFLSSTFTHFEPASGPLSIDTINDIFCDVFTQTIQFCISIGVDPIVNTVTIAKLIMKAMQTMHPEWFTGGQIPPNWDLDVDDDYFVYKMNRHFPTLKPDHTPHIVTADARITEPYQFALRHFRNVADRILLADDAYDMSFYSTFERAGIRTRRTEDYHFSRGYSHTDCAYLPFPGCTFPDGYSPVYARHVCDDGNFFCFYHACSALYCPISPVQHLVSHGDIRYSSSSLIPFSPVCRFVEPPASAGAFLDPNSGKIITPQSLTSHPLSGSASTFRTRSGLKITPSMVALQEARLLDDSRRRSKRVVPPLPSRKREVVESPTSSRSKDSVVKAVARLRDTRIVRDFGRKWDLDVTSDLQKLSLRVRLWAELQFRERTTIGFMRTIFQWASKGPHRVSIVQYLKVTGWPLGRIV
jgi:hypothetical protein